MVDVGGKGVTRREATAVARVTMRPATLRLIIDGDLPKGPALEVARIAGILAAKKVPDLIPLCHPLPLDSVDIDLVPAGDSTVEVRATVRTEARTGAEMEALTAASVAALALYDMCKSAEKGIVIREIALERKSGGKGGEYRRSGS